MNTALPRTGCTELPKDKVEAALDGLPEELRRKARRWYHRTIDEKDRHGERKAYPYRHGSDQYGKDHSEFAVDDEQRELMFDLNQEGCSFREVEAIMHLIPNSGNDAQRCINKHIEALAAQGKLNFKPKAKGRVSRAQALNIVKTYVRHANPAKAKAIYKAVSDIIPNEDARRRSGRVPAAV